MYFLFVLKFLGCKTFIHFGTLNFLDSIFQSCSSGWSIFFPWYSYVGKLNMIESNSFATDKDDSTHTAKNRHSGSGVIALILIIVDLLFPWWIVNHCLIALPFLIFMSAALLWSIPWTAWCHFTEMVPLWRAKCNPSLCLCVCFCLKMLSNRHGTNRLSFKWNIIHVQV